MNPVVHWQILTPDPAQAEQFYSQMFGWEVTRNDALQYRRVNTGQEGLDGGIWPLESGSRNMVQLFVQVEDVAAAVARAQELGGNVVMPPQMLPDGDEMAIVVDPGGNGARPDEGAIVRAFALTAFLAVVLLFGLNMALFPLFFSEGPPNIYRDPRAEPKLGYHALATLCVAVLLVWIYRRPKWGPHPALQGLSYGVLMTLFVSLPVAFHTHALAEVPVLPIGPLLFTALVWGLTGAGIAVLFDRLDRGAKGS